MKVLFTSAINPYSLAENLYEPLWPAYLTAFAEKELGAGSIDFIYDAGKIEELLQKHAPDVLAISSVTQNFKFAEQYAAAAAARKIPVVIGGMHISSLPVALTPHMNVGCIGEGENTFCQLLRIFIDKGAFNPADLHAVPGVAFMDKDRLVETPLAAQRLAIDQIPHPKRSLIGYRRRGYVYSARGCPYNCVFCSCARFWGKVRYASPEYILEEINELATHGAQVIRFSDENFVANSPRLIRIAELIREQGLHKKIKFSCWCRANNVTPEIVGTLKSMNVVSIKMGLESGSDRILDYLKGGVTVAQNERAVTLFKDAGIQTNADFIFGAPDETLDEIEQTYRFIKKSRIDLFDVDIFSPLPGTPVWEYAKKRNLVSDKMDWGRLNYKFNQDTATAIHLSEILTYEQLLRMSRRFKRLRTFRTLIALPRSPWLNELPGLVVRRISGRIRSLLAKAFSKR
jgi:anaerobic magnesium-protoporphyrin IX monomethyl ester cyclase